MIPISYYNPIVVTGASGFIGKCAVSRLLKDGYEIHLLLRPEANLWRLQDVIDQVTVHQVDLRDKVGVRNVFENISPKSVLHLATHGAYEWETNARQILETDILGSYNLLEAAIAVHSRIFINAGSSSEYGYKNQPMSEYDRLDPNSIYAVAKAAQTNLCCFLAKTSDVKILTFRLFSVFGPWEAPKRLFPAIIRCALAGQPLKMSSPDTVRDFVYVEDVLDAMLEFEKLAKHSGEIFNLGTGNEFTLKDVVKIVLATTKSNSEVHWASLPVRKWDANRWQADITKTHSILGWSPRYSLAEGVKQMTEWLKEHACEYNRIESST